MTREDAAIIVATLAAGFHREALEPETIELWTQEMIGFADRNIAAIVARGIIREQEHFPTLARFRECYTNEYRNSVHENASKRGLPEPERNTVIPTWVHVWSHMRSLGDDRPLPQQRGYVDEAQIISDAEYAAAATAWEAAGSPKMAHVGDHHPLGEVTSSL